VLDGVDVRIGEVRVWGGERTQTQQKKLFEKKTPEKKDKRLLTGSNPQANSNFQ
jgi:hypothetical protein